MSQSAPLTFRDFAAAVMRQDAPAAATVLQQLLALDAAAAQQATAHFLAQAQAQGPSFMGKAMSLRTVRSEGSEAEIRTLLVALFALTEPALGTAAVAVRAL